MGVLVGTSLIVIIPEGIETLYSAKSASRTSISTRSAAVEWQSQGASISAPVINHEQSVSPIDMPVPSLSLESDPLPETTTLRIRKEESASDGSSKEEEKEEEESSPHAWIGIALISGFIMMYLIDKVPEFASPSKTERTPYHISLDNLGSGLRRSSSPTRDGGLLNGGGPSSSRRGHSFATTTGLVIHAAADGIALGASSSDTGLSFIIFFAIMVHKAPASFGLTSVLLKQGLSSRTARAHLLVFSLAAPVGALVTFLFANMVGSSGGDGSSALWRTGMLLLFSGGTFL